MIGKPSLPAPMITTFELPLRASSLVASMPFHFRRFSLMPSVTIFWKLGDAFRFNFVAFSFLFFLQQNELHPRGFLLSAQFFLDGLLQPRRQRHIAQQHPLDHNAAWLDRSWSLREPPCAHLLSPAPS